MSQAVLVIGESGTGKSTSLRNLNPAETYIISVLNKPLPFKNKYTKTTPEKAGNFFVSDDFNKISSCIRYVNAKRPEIKNLVIDDWQYMMSNHFMRRSTERGFDKFTEIGKEGWRFIMEVNDCRDDLTCFVLAHSDKDMDGVARLKTIGKMLNEKVCLEGMFTIVLHSLIVDQEYKFMTQGDGTHIAKSPMNMFERLIDNDLAKVKQSIEGYYK